MSPEAPGRLLGFIPTGWYPDLGAGAAGRKADRGERQGPSFLPSSHGTNPWLWKSDREKLDFVEAMPKRIDFAPPRSGREPTERLYPDRDDNSPYATASSPGRGSHRQSDSEPGRRPESDSQPHLHPEGNAAPTTRFWATWRKGTAISRRPYSREDHAPIIIGWPAILFCLDNFYCAGDTGKDGFNWTTSAIAPDQHPTDSGLGGDPLASVAAYFPIRRRPGRDGFRARRPALGSRGGKSCSLCSYDILAVNLPHVRRSAGSRSRTSLDPVLKPHTKLLLPALGSGAVWV